MVKNTISCLCLLLVTSVLVVNSFAACLYEVDHFYYKCPNTFCSTCEFAYADVTYCSGLTCQAPFVIAIEVNHCDDCECVVTGYTNYLLWDSCP